MSLHYNLSDWIHFKHAMKLQSIRFCPTGGVSLANRDEYLSLPNVDVVGGSWVAPKSAIQAGDWDELTALARDAIKAANVINA